MRLDTTTVLVDFTGAPILKDEKSLTVGATLIEALLGLVDGGPAVTGEEKLDRYRLARRIRDNASINLKAEDVVLLKRLTGAFYVPVVAGQLWEILEGQDVE